MLLGTHSFVFPSSVSRHFVVHMEPPWKWVSVYLPSSCHMPFELKPGAASRWGHPGGGVLGDHVLGPACPQPLSLVGKGRNMPEWLMVVTPSKCGVSRLQVCVPCPALGSTMPDRCLSFLAPLWAASQLGLREVSVASKQPQK